MNIVERPTTATTTTACDAAQVGQNCQLCDQTWTETLWEAASAVWLGGTHAAPPEAEGQPAAAAGPDGAAPVIRWPQPPLS